MSDHIGRRLYTQYMIAYTEYMRSHTPDARIPGFLDWASLPLAKQFAWNHLALTQTIDSYPVTREYIVEIFGVGGPPLVVAYVDFTQFQLACVHLLAAQLDGKRAVEHIENPLPGDFRRARFRTLDDIDPIRLAHVFVDQGIFDVPIRR